MVLGRAKVSGLYPGGRSRAETGSSRAFLRPTQVWNKRGWDTGRLGGLLGSCHDYPGARMGHLNQDKAVAGDR